MITITYPGGRINAQDAEDAADQLMGRQSFGAYPLWSWDDDGGCWLYYDGAEDYGHHCPRAAVEDLRGYAAWSLEVDDDQVRIQVSADDPLRMTGAEVTAAREALGLTTAELAALAGVHPQTPHRWEASREPAPVRIGGLLADLTREHDDLVDLLVERTDDIRADCAAVIVPRTQEEYEALHPDASRPLRWLRLAARRAARRAPQLRIVRDEAEAERLGAQVIHPSM